VDTAAVAVDATVGSDVAVVVALAVAEHDGSAPRPAVRHPAHGQGVGADEPGGQ
jgi:hypothetical protein